MYVRRSQVYRKVRSHKLAQGHYIVQQEVTGKEYYVFRRPEGDWAYTGRTEPVLRVGFRKKDEVMELLAAS